jgi:hypothetical protein
MAKIVEDIQIASNWAAHALTVSGYKVDFSLASLWEIERFFCEHSDKGIAKPDGLLAQDLGSRIFALGAYVGEVLRRYRNGQWVGDDNDPKVEVNIELHFPDAEVCWPIQRVMKRFKNGSEDCIGFYGYAMGLPVGERPKVP